MMRGGWRARIGIALGADRLVAALPRGRTLETPDVADLRQTFKELRARCGRVRATVDVALVPPLVEVRTVALPPLREDERQRVLARDARRYFVGLSDPVVVGSVASGAQVLVAAASVASVADIGKPPSTSLQAPKAMAFSDFDTKLRDKIDGARQR